VDVATTAARARRVAFALFALIATVLSGAAGGCQRHRQGPAPVRIGYFANLSHAQAVLGVSSGDFARAVLPAKLETRVFNAGPSLIEALFAGEIDIGYVGPGPATGAYGKSHGEGIRVIAGAAANGVVVVARAGSGIVTMRDLAGRRIATPQLGNTQDVSARHFALRTLEQKDAKNVVPIENQQQAAMLARGDVDAAWVPEPWGQRLIAEAGATLLAEEKDLWPAKVFPLTVVVTTPEFLAARPDVVSAMLAAHRTWTARLTEAPEAHVDALGDALLTLTGRRLDAAVLRPALHRVKFTDDPQEDSLRTFSQWTHDLGFDRGSPDVTHLVDRTLLNRLIAARAQASANANAP
jgi:NitT/TauT family transport system substrate-binding protein